MSPDDTPATDTSWRTVLAPHMTPDCDRRCRRGDLRRRLPGPDGGDVPALHISYLLVLALGDSRGRVHGPHVHRLPRLRARLVPALEARERDARRRAGVLLYTPFAWWRHEHAVHHATTGDLDKRGVGDIQTLTVEEYRARPGAAGSGYRLFRNPFVMFVFGPLWVLLIGQRLITRGMRPRLRNSVLGTNLALVVVVAGLCWLVGWKAFLLVQGPPLLLAGAAGIWLFYVQHQFEDAYWQTSETWSFDEAALQGSSYLELPRILRFFTGNIGFHHIHHLSARIPNYNLQAAHKAGRLEPVTTLSLRDGIRAVRLKLWDQDQHRLVTFREAGRNRSLTNTGVAD